ncbi:hypothetical protein SDC9_60232 [bioreactor metagenome]|jgi:hypothetical protein|uniref:Uncharacterized protein n=1 Tax=bioreactor metagenome TaxID=1076179 RepID=A0A644XCF9_9ZZZZ
MSNKEDLIVKKIVDLVLQLSQELSRIEGITAQDLFPLLPNREAKAPFINSKPIANQVFRILKSQNGEMLSDEVIMSRLICEVAGHRLQIPISDENLEKLARENTVKLLDYHATRDVDIPIVCLKVGDKPIEFGPITFIELTPEDFQTEWGQRLSDTFTYKIGGQLLSFARVNVPGDLSTSIKNATSIVREGLLILRGICFPITPDETSQIGIINDYSLIKNVYYRNSKPDVNTQINAESELVTKIGHPLQVYRLFEDLLNRIPTSKMNNFLNFIQKNGFRTQNEFQQKVLSGFTWIGEATQPDILAARYTKISFALESFIGGESNDAFVSSRGITATLSERAAFILGKNKEDRIRIHKAISGYYGKRSKTVHGTKTDISEIDFRDFGNMVRDIGLVLVEKLETFSSAKDLEKWTVEQRYS